MNATDTCMHMIYFCQSADTVLSILRTKHIPTVKKKLVYQYHIEYSMHS